MKHKHAELLHYAAENADARFTCVQYGNANIHAVLSSPHCDWHIVKQPVVEVRYYRYEIIKSDLTTGYVECCSDNWNMRITITDGDIPNAKVELR